MIHIVEDDQSIRDLEVYALTQAGYEVRAFADGKAFFQAIGEAPPTLVLLDVMLPGDDGYTVLCKLKANPQTRSIPVIMLTAKGEEIDKIRALDGGADDYIVKPFGVMEMIARVKAVLRRSAPKEREPVLAVDGIVLDTKRHQVLANGEPVTLTHMEFALLQYMMENKGLVLTRECLLDAVWSMEYLGDTRTVDVHIRMLRQKLNACGDRIRTVRGVGYCLEGMGDGIRD